MLGWEITEIQRPEPADAAPLFAYSGVVGVTGVICGSVVLRVAADVAKNATAILHDLDISELDEEDVIDTVGELANMVVGCAKSRFGNHDLAITVPNVITGLGHGVTFANGVDTVTIDFDSEWGPVAVNVGLKHVEEPACS
jgi:CheY-specific phosphatase CheX